MGYSELIDAVQDHAGLASRRDAEATTTAVFRAIARRVLSADRRAVRALLPAELAPLFEEGDAVEGAEVDGLVAEIAADEGVSPGFGREHLVAVAAAAARMLHPDAVVALRTHLPGPLAVLFVSEPAPRVTRPTPNASPRAGRRLSGAKGGGRHLSAAKPGSARPLSQARPRGHSESVAESEDPHGDTKLSSAEGSTQSREHESLAEGED